MGPSFSCFQERLLIAVLLHRLIKGGDPTTISAIIAISICSFLFGIFVSFAIQLIRRSRRKGHAMASKLQSTFDPATIPTTGLISLEPNQPISRPPGAFGCREAGHFPRKERLEGKPQELMVTVEKPINGHVNMMKIDELGPHAQVTRQLIQLPYESASPLALSDGSSTSLATPTEWRRALYRNEEYGSRNNAVHQPIAQQGVRERAAITQAVRSRSMPTIKNNSKPLYSTESVEARPPRSTNTSLKLGGPWERSNKMQRSSSVGMNEYLDSFPTPPSSTCFDSSLQNSPTSASYCSTNSRTVKSTVPHTTFIKSVSSEKVSITQPSPVVKERTRNPEPQDIDQLDPFRRCSPPHTRSTLSERSASFYVEQTEDRQF